MVAGILQDRHGHPDTPPQEFVVVVVRVAGRDPEERRGQRPQQVLQGDARVAPKGIEGGFRDKRFELFLHIPRIPQD